MTLKPNLPSNYCCNKKREKPLMWDCLQVLLRKVRMISKSLIFTDVFREGQSLSFMRKTGLQL